MNTSHTTRTDGLLPEQAQFLHQVQEQGLEMKLALLQHHAHLAKLLAQEIMKDEVIGLAGEHYSHEKPNAGRYRRWGKNPGGIQVNGERMRMDIPRLRDVEEGRERPLKSYQAMKRPLEVDTKLEEAILLGLSQRDYGRIARAFADRFGLSQSSVSRQFAERSREALEEFEERSIEDKDITALVIDGKYLAKHQIVVCLGIDMEGNKIPLGIVERPRMRWP